MRQAKRRRLEEFESEAPVSNPGCNPVPFDECSLLAALKDNLVNTQDTDACSPSSSMPMPTGTGNPVKSGTGGHRPLPPLVFVDLDTSSCASTELEYTDPDE